jgi:hypothetical protein
MQVTTKITWNLETGEITEHAFYVYDGPVELACSAGSKEVEANDIALQNSQIAMNTTLSNDYSTTFAQNQAVLGQQQARLNAIAANPMGFTPQQLHTATTSVNENTATAAKQAIGAAAGYAAAHGGADVGGGGTAQLAGEIESAAGQSKAQQLSNLSTASEELKQQNMWKALGGLSEVGSGYGSAGSTAIGGAGTAAQTATGAGTGAVQAEEAASQEIGGVLGGIGGLVSAGASFVGANPGGIFGS